MADDGTVVAISFKDIEPDEEVRERAEKRCRALAEEFPEPTHIEVTLAPDGAGFSAHAHVTGRDGARGLARALRARRWPRTAPSTSSARRCAAPTTSASSPAAAKRCSENPKRRGR